MKPLDFRPSIYRGGARYPYVPHSIDNGPIGSANGVPTLVAGKPKEISSQGANIETLEGLDRDQNTSSDGLIKCQVFFPKIRDDPI